jgi:5-methyltetrahydropteroyltriglutamate--homocysteine methyltransferase
VALSQSHSRDYYRRLQYLMGDFSPHVLGRARQAVGHHGEHVTAGPLPEPDGGGLGLAGDFRFARNLTDLPMKVSMTGPFSLSRRIRGSGYSDPADLVRVLARYLRAEAAELAGAGARVLQIDEPFLAGYPEQAALAVEAVNIVTDVPGVTWVLHVCYGNRYARPLWEGHYDFLFPAVKEARIDQLALEFARRGDDELELLKRYGWELSRNTGLPGLAVGA